MSLLVLALFLDYVLDGPDVLPAQLRLEYSLLQAGEVSVAEGAGEVGVQDTEDPKQGFSEFGGYCLLAEVIERRQRVQHCSLGRAQHLFDVLIVQGRTLNSHLHLLISTNKPL